MRAPGPRRVVHYVDGEVFGGSEEAALQLMASLDRGQWEPVLLHHTGAARLAEGARDIGVRTVTTGAPPRAAPVRSVGPLWRAVRAERPAVFHAHLSWPLGCKYGALAARLARVPAVVGTAQLWVELKSRRPPLAPKLFHRIIAVSREVERRYARTLHVPPNRLVVVPNGIRVPLQAPVPDPALRAGLVRGRPEYVVLTPARLHPQKGHAYLLAAAALVPDATFVLAGDGPLRVELERSARELGIADRCVLLGERHDVPALLAASDLFVLPSLYEGLPVSVLEAMAACRPIVATGVGGTDEAVMHERTGLLVPPRDPASLAAAIRRLRADPALAQRLAQAGRERVEHEFSAEVTALRVMRVYDEVLADG